MKKLIISVGMVVCCSVASFAESKGNTSETDSFLWWLIVVSVVVFVTLCIALFLWLSFRDKVVSVVIGNEEEEGSRRISAYFDILKQNISDSIYRQSNNKMSGNDARIYEDKIQQLERRLGELKSEVDKLKTASSSGGQISNNGQYQGVSYGSKFFRSKNGKVLTEEVPDSREASFKVFNIRGTEALFEYCGKVQNSDFFIDVCSFENNPNDVPNKSKIVTTKSGTVKKDTNNNWEVISLAKIKFE